MTDGLADPLLEAIAFAARAHEGQRRKDGATPYVSHVFRVCLIVRHVFEVDDRTALMTAALHDTLEDTTTDFDDLAERFGADVASWVAMLSKDSRLPEPEREQSYQDILAGAPWQVKVCKLADMYDNLSDSRHLREEKRRRTFAKLRGYLSALRQELPEQATTPWRLVSDLLTQLERS